MKKYYFNYLKNFKCIAQNCKHSCCKGWQISIDKKSLSKYRRLNELEGFFEGKIDQPNSRFIQDTQGRCAFLDQDGLCLLIKKYGDGALCSTCKTHPRFKSYFKGFCEIGAGLSCEEVARLIITSKRKMKINGVKNLIKENPFLTDFEKKVIRFRNKVIKLTQNRALKISERINELLTICAVDINAKTLSSWFEFFNSLEKLDLTTTEVFNKIACQNVTCEKLNLDNLDKQIEYEQILSYFVFRHIPRAIDIVDLKLQLAFSILSFLSCVALYESYFKNVLNPDTYALIEACRLYSSEIEYSQNNLDAILEELENYIKLN